MCCQTFNKRIKKKSSTIVLLDASDRNADDKRVVIVVINNNNISECGFWFENVHSNSESDNY